MGLKTFNFKQLRNSGLFILCFGIVIGIFGDGGWIRKQNSKDKHGIREMFKLLFPFRIGKLR